MSSQLIAYFKERQSLSYWKRRRDHKKQRAHNIARLVGLTIGAHQIHAVVDTDSETAVEEKQRQTGEKPRD